MSHFVVLYNVFSIAKVTILSIEAKTKLIYVYFSASQCGLACIGHMYMQVHTCTQSMISKKHHWTWEMVKIAKPWEDRRFLEGPIVRIKRLCSTIMCGRGLEYKQSIIISTHTLLPICSNKENLINLQIV